MSEESGYIFDREIRNKGTVLKLLRNNLFEVIEKNAPIEVIDNSHYPLPQKFSIYELKDKEFSVFDRLELRNTNIINPAIPPSGATVVLYSSVMLTIDQKTEVFEWLTSLYGKDNLLNFDLSNDELKILKQNSWMGRYWVFNQHHSIHSSDYPGDKYYYSVELQNQGEDGLKLIIYQFREAIKIFDS